MLFLEQLRMLTMTHGREDLLVGSLERRAGLVSGHSQRDERAEEDREASDGERQYGQPLSYAVQSRKPVEHERGV